MTSAQFPSAIKRSSVPNMEILGAPIGDKECCIDFVAQKRANASKLLAQMEQVGSTDSQVALLLFGLCGGFCKLVHISRSTPPSLISDALMLTYVAALQRVLQLTPHSPPGSK